jgi:MFS family permease
VKYRWTRDLNRYHWFVLIVAALGWLFDTMDQQLFNLARTPAMRELLTVDGKLPEPAAVREASGQATSIFLIGWATGGLAFGVLGDRIGRAKTMLWTILIYSLCTGLSAFSVGVWDFAFYRFLTGLGVGGEFAVGVALVAEVMPDRARPYALGLLQALSAVGNITAAFISMALGSLERAEYFEDVYLMGFPVNPWRIMFVIGTVPALLAIFIRRRLKEPERWQSAIASGEKKKLGSYSELFGDPRWRKNAIVGMLLAFSGVVGLWGIGFFSFDLLQSIFRPHLEGQGLSPQEVGGRIGIWIGITSVMQNLGGFFGIYAFSRVTHHLGRKLTLAIGFVLAMLSTAYVFWNIDASSVTLPAWVPFFGGSEVFTDVFWMIPIMGFCQLSLFGGYAIYFPELFPTRLRSTGTSFCYNVGRFVAAVGPPALSRLSNDVFGSYAEPLPWRYAAVTMCSVFLLGLAVLPFCPETKGKPLPE